MKKLLLFLPFLALGQPINQVLIFNANPVGTSCAPRRLATDTSDNHLLYCNPTTKLWVDESATYTGFTDNGVTISTTRSVSIKGVLFPEAITSTTLAPISSFTYTSGVTATCTNGDYLKFTFSDGTVAHVACAAGGNDITGGTAGTSIAVGTGFSSPPTTATCSVGTIGTTCSGVIVLASILSVNAVQVFNLNSTSGPLTYNVPTPATSVEYCFRNNTGKSGIITLQLPAATTIDVAGIAGTAAGTLVSNGALGDAVCIIGVNTTTYLGYPSSGTWTNN